MKRLLTALFVILIILSFVTGCSKVGDEKKKITISAAISLQSVLQDIQKEYETNNPDIKVVFNFGSSGTLQKQIEEGAPVDLFISAGVKQMDGLEKKGLIIKKSRLDLLSNNLVLIVQKNNPAEILSVEDLGVAKVKAISIGIPETVPAGSYAKEALVALNLWEQIESKLIYAKDVKQVLTYVESGNIDAGLVYQSDVNVSEKIRVVQKISDEYHHPILYLVAIIEDTKNRTEAENFLRYLQVPENQDLYLKYGFKPIN